MLSLSAARPYTSENTFFYNNVAHNMTIVKFSNNYGSFDDKPPNNVEANGQAQWSMTADLFHSFGWMGYDVWYKPTDGSFGGCLDLSYLWDLVFGVCQSGFTDCPGEDGVVPKNRTLSKSIKHASGGMFHVKDDCAAWGNPSHTLYYTDANGDETILSTITGAKINGDSI